MYKLYNRISQKEPSTYVHYGESDSSTKPVSARVSQGSVLGSLLYLLYTADIPEQEDTLIATFVDDTAINTQHNDYATATATDKL